MIFVKIFLLLLTTLWTQSTTASRSLPTTSLNRSNKSLVDQVRPNSYLFELKIRHGLLQVGRATNKPAVPTTDPSTTVPSKENVESAEDEEENGEVFVNTLLETPNEPAVVNVPELRHGPEYDLDWTFIDKDSIRVTFDLYSLPKSLIDVNKYSESTENKQSLLATMISMPSRAVKTIFSLEYFLFIIRPYKSNKEIILKMEKLHPKENGTGNYTYFSNSLRLTALNPKEKYSVCICYYRTNISTETPDLLLCQDIINDYSKFSDLRTDPKHGLVFITTQYSIIIALLAILQGTFTMRQRRFAQIIRQHLATKAQSIRSTLSSVSLVRQSFSSLNTAGEQQHHVTNGQAMQHEPTIIEEEGGGGGAEEESRNPNPKVPSPKIIISNPSSETNHGANGADETEPFLRRIPSKNHVHFLLGPGEGSDDENTDDEHEHIPLNSTSHRMQTTTSSNQLESYNDQTDALLSMAHILDTNKPWSRHDHDPSMA